MPISKLSLAVVMLSMASLAAHAQDATVLDDLDVERVSPTQIEIEFDYEGGACEETGMAEVGENLDGTLSVTVPTSSTAEVCTMQVVEIDFKQTIDADETVSRVEVTLLAPDGSVQATGSDDVDDD